MSVPNNTTYWCNLINDEFETKKELSNETLKKILAVFSDPSIDHETQKEVLSTFIDIAIKEDRNFRKGSKREIIEC